jgi:hypothetical protein
MVTPMTAPDTAALEALRAEAQADTPAAQPMEGEGAPAATPMMDPAIQWEGLLKMAVTMLTPAMPFLPSIYTDECLATLAAAIVPVAEKYNFDPGELFGKYAPEINLALIAGPLVVRTVLEFRALRAAQDKARQEAARAARQAATQRAEAESARA